MNMIRTIERRLQRLLRRDVAGRTAVVKDPSPAIRLCKFGHAVFDGNNLCTYGHRPA